MSFGEVLLIQTMVHNIRIVDSTKRHLTNLNVLHVWIQTNFATKTMQFYMLCNVLYVGLVKSPVK